MTAQVFRNGQQATFYVSDALTPAGGGIDATFQNLTVTKSETVGAGVTAGKALTVIKTVAGTSPIEVRGSAADPSNGLIVTQTGHLPNTDLVAFGANTSEANEAAYVFAYGGMDLKFAAGGAELLRLKNTGIAANTAATNVLALQPGSTTVFTNALASGVTTPLWATVSGWANPAVILNLSWQRVGNLVSCWGVFLSPITTVGANVATITIPVPRTSGPFTGAGAECVGIVTFRKTAGGTADFGSIAGTAGSSTTVSLTITGTAPAGAGTVSASFAYQL